MFQRSSGILMHISSLPSDFGIGDVGPEAKRFIDVLASNRQRYWQMLPLNPTIGVNGHSPYSSLSVFAGNPLLISPELIVEKGYLLSTDLLPDPLLKKTEVDYDAVVSSKEKLLNKAYRHFQNSDDKTGYAKFCIDNKFWLDDYALYMTLKNIHEDKPWYKWPSDLRKRDPVAIENVIAHHIDQINYFKFEQFLFFTQWSELKEYAKNRNVQIIGDIPIYVNHDSVDVWTSPHLFKLDDTGYPIFVSGVPPDYFSEEGQRWGNPVYDWAALAETDFKWWIDRFRHNFMMFDVVRVDHFRGLIQYWEIEVEEKTAVNGRWVDVPYKEFFKKLLNVFDPFCIIAEDLGIITPDVTEAMESYGFPGMKLLIFAFGEDDPKHPYLPKNFKSNCVVYTGTHDNNTVLGWFQTEADNKTKDILHRYVEEDLDEQNIYWLLNVLAMRSKANLAILPLQDILGLDSRARMNTPGTIKGNWKWRLTDGAFREDIQLKLKELTIQSERA